jgi:hypothetical protein
MKKAIGLLCNRQMLCERTSDNLLPLGNREVIYAYTHDNTVTIQYSVKPVLWAPVRHWLLYFFLFTKEPFYAKKFYSARF